MRVQGKAGEDLLPAMILSLTRANSAREGLR